MKYISTFLTSSQICPNKLDLTEIDIIFSENICQEIYLKILKLYVLKLHLTKQISYGNNIFNLNIKVINKRTTIKTTILICVYILI